MAINFLWWAAQPILFGAAITNIQTTDLFGETIKTNMARPMGFFESLIDFNIKNPIIFVWAYLSVMLKYKKATLGQIAANTAVINEEGSDDLSWSTALKRGIIERHYKHYFFLNCFRSFNVFCRRKENIT